MKKLTIIIALASVLVIAALVGVVFAQNVNAQPSNSTNGQVNNINGNTCINAGACNNAACINNGSLAGNCTQNGYCQAQQCHACNGIGANGQNQCNVGSGYGCGSGMQRGCR